MTSSQNSDKTGTFLTSEAGDPRTGIREITPYLFRVLAWWAAHPSLRFLEREPPESKRSSKLFFQLRGVNRLRKGRDKLDLQPGQLGVVLDGERHEEAWTPDGEGRYLQVFVGLQPGRLSVNIAGEGDPLGLGGHSRIYAGASLPFTEGALVDQYLGFLHRRTDRKVRQCAVLADLLRHGVRLQGVPGESRMIRQAVTTVVENPCHPSLSVKWLAGRLGCHPDYLSRRFREETGRNLMVYVRELRMEIAADLLLGKLLPVSEVAGLCGYRDHSYFSRIFHRHYGSTPSAYSKSP